LIYGSETSWAGDNTGPTDRIEVPILKTAQRSGRLPARARIRNNPIAASAPANGMAMWDSIVLRVGA
jgi:hypothetical protein